MPGLRLVTKRYRDCRDLYGKPCPLVSFPFWFVQDRRHGGPLGKYISLSRRIPGWTRGSEAVALARVSYSLPDDAVIVENGSFLGCSTVLLAGARKLRGSGKVHSIDPFDATGDAFSAPIYSAIRSSIGISLLQSFTDNIRRAGLTEWVEVHQGRAREVAMSWTEPIDLFFLDGDQSYDGVLTAYQSWSPFLKHGGIIAVHNSADRVYEPDHDGSRRLVVETIRPPEYQEIRCVDGTTFARKAVDSGR